MQELQTNLATMDPAANRVAGPDAARGVGDGTGEQVLTLDGRLPGGEQLALDARVPGDGAQGLRLHLDARTRETLAQGPLSAAFGQGTLTLAERDGIVLASARGPDGRATTLRGAPLADGSVELRPDARAQSGAGRTDRDDDPGPWPVDYVEGRIEWLKNAGSSFLGGAWKELANQWNTTVSAIKTIEQATFAPLHSLYGSLAADTAGFGGGNYTAEFEQTREAWQKIGNTGGEFLELLWNGSAPGGVVNSTRSIINTTERLQSEALRGDGIDPATVREIAREELGANPSVQATDTVVDALTNYRAVAREAANGASSALYEEIGRSTVRVVDLLAGIKLGKSAGQLAREPDTAYAAGRRAADADIPDMQGIRLDGSGRMLAHEGPLAGADRPAEIAERIRQLEQEGTVARLNQGNISTVYRLTGETDSKVIRVGQRADTSMIGTQPQSVAQEAREAVAAGRLAIGPRVNVAESAVFGNERYMALVMEDAGRPLDEIAGETLSTSRSEAIATDLAETVGRAHRMNWAHGDLSKSGNILVTEAGDVRLIDFEHGRQIRREALDAPSRSQMEKDIRNLVRQAEQLRPGDVDASTWNQRVGDAYLESLRADGYPEHPGPASAAALEHRAAKVEKAEQYLQEVLAKEGRR